MKSKWIIALLWLMPSGLSLPVSAQGTAFTYQGQLRDNGAPSVYGNLFAYSPPRIMSVSASVNRREAGHLIPNDFRLRIMFSFCIARSMSARVCIVFSCVGVRNAAAPFSTLA